MSENPTESEKVGTCRWWAPYGRIKWGEGECLWPVPPWLNKFKFVDCAKASQLLLPRICESCPCWQRKEGAE